MLIAVNEYDINLLKHILPPEVIDRLIELNAIEDEAFGADRNPFSDDGGCVLVYSPHDRLPAVEAMDGDVEIYGEWTVGFAVVNNETIHICVWREQDRKGSLT